MDRDDGGQFALPDPRDEPTVNIERAAQCLGVGRNTAYEAASRGEIPTIRIGRRLLVPTAKLLEMLGQGGEAADSRPAA